MDAYSLVINWKGKKDTTKPRYNDGVNFNMTDKYDTQDNFVNINKGNIIKKKNGQLVKCFICRGNHYKSDCPENPKTEATDVTTLHAQAQPEIVGEDNRSLSTGLAVPNNDTIITATVVGTANVTSSNAGNQDDWGTYNFGGVQFFNLGADINNK